MSDISSDVLGAIFSALGEQLGSRRAAIHLVVIGGSGLLAMRLGDRPRMQEAANRVADDVGLKRTWLNHGPTSLLDFGLPEGFEDRMTTVDYGAGLRVSFASRLDQIHLKLYAFADRREARDESDLQRLAPTADELTAAARWARTHNAPGPFDDELADALRAFGVSDVGRDV